MTTLTEGTDGPGRKDGPDNDPEFTDEPVCGQDAEAGRADSDDSNSGSFVALGMALALPFGAVLGLVFLDNLALGLAIGIGLGPVVGLILGAARSSRGDHDGERSA